MSSALPSARFTVRNDGFDCLFCGAEVLPLKGGCRNHCPVCLSSLHVDYLPGDRANPCLGQLKAVDYELSAKKGIVLIFSCRRCGQKTRNKAADQAVIQPDDLDQILALKKF